MEIFYLFPFFVLLLIAVSMMAQGWMIVTGNSGYNTAPKIKRHPEMVGVKDREVLMGVSFTKENKYSDLYERIQALKDKEENL